MFELERFISEESDCFRVPWCEIHAFVTVTIYFLGCCCFSLAWVAVKWKVGNDRETLAQIGRRPPTIQDSTEREKKGGIEVSEIRF